MTRQLQESSINIIAEGTHIQGKVTFSDITRFHGVLSGEARATEGSTLILCEPCVVEGNVHADVLIVDGYVQGDIHAKTSVLISGTGRVIGNIQTPSLKLEFGAHFEGKCLMESLQQLLKTDPNHPGPRSELSG